MTAKPAELVMLETFDAYPEGVKVRFTKGERRSDLEPTFADLLVAKGLAQPAGESKPKSAKRKSDAV